MTDAEMLDKAASFEGIERLLSWRDVDAVVIEAPPIHPNKPCIALRRDGREDRYEGNTIGEAIWIAVDYLKEEFKGDVEAAKSVG